MMNQQRGEWFKMAIKGGLIFTFHKPASIKEKKKKQKMVMMMKKEMVIAMMMMILIAGAQVQAQYGPPADSDPRRPPKRHCISHCALRCLFRLRLQPVAYMLCFNLCLLKCKFLPPLSVYDCTSSCANSKTINANTEAGDVEGYVETCYDNCKTKQL